MQSFSTLYLGLDPIVFKHELYVEDAFFISLALHSRSCMRFEIKKWLSSYSFLLMYRGLSDGHPKGPQIH